MSSPRTPVPLGYVEHAPPPDLTASVRCVWTRSYTTPHGSPAHLALPDGCVDIFFGFGAESRHGCELTVARIVGPTTKPILVQGTPPRLCLGIRLAPAVAGAALGLPGCELLDQSVAFADVFRDAAVDTDMLSAAASDEQRVVAAFDLVRRRLVRRDKVPLGVRAAVRHLIGAEGNTRVGSLADEIGVTRQQLARQFATHVGMTPKEFARVVRVRGAVARADAAHAVDPRRVSWSRIAQELGYYDQSHFIGEFKALTGLTPGHWHLETGHPT